MNIDNILEVKNLYKSYDGKKNILKNLSFNVKKGSVVGILGANGAGKTTLIKTILGLLHPSSGDVMTIDSDSRDLSETAKAKVGYVSQEVKGLEWMKVKDYLAFIGSFYPSWDQEKLLKLAEEWKLDINKRVRKLSGGQKQKAAILASMGHSPELYVFDEPVASLDPTSRRDFIKQMIEHNLDQNSTVLFSTHIVSDIERMAADIIFLKDGRILYYGSISDLQERVKKLRIFTEEDLNDSFFEEKRFRNVMKKAGSYAVLSTEHSEELERRLEEQGYEFTVEELNLEDIFIELNK
jgi:ABC-2 type transport system ATP-binding protein